MSADAEQQVEDAALRAASALIAQLRARGVILTVVRLADDMGLGMSMQNYALLTDTDWAKLMLLRVPVLVHLLTEQLSQPQRPSAA